MKNDKKSVPDAEPVNLPVAEAAKDDGQTKYLVTEKAGPRVAGQRVKLGDQITLSEDEARGEVIMGTIEKAQ